MLAIFPRTPAAAHPLGNFTINRYSRLELTPQHLRVRYVVDMAEIPAFQQRQRIDANANDVIEPSEQATFLASQTAAIVSQLKLQIDERTIPLTLREQNLTFPKGQGGLLTLRLALWLEAELPAAGALVYRDDTFADRLGWREIVVQAGTGVAVSASTVSGVDVSQELTLYPTDMLQRPLAVREARLGWAPGVGAALPSSAQAPNSPATPDRFAALIAVPVTGVWGWLGLLALAFGLGAAHALAPGHGKTIVAAYLVGARGTAKHALFLGLTTTVTHTAGVFALGLITLFVSRFILPEQLYPWLGVLSGLLVVWIGVTLFGSRLRGWLSGHKGAPSQPHGGLHEHGPDTHMHTPPQQLGWRSLLALGVSGGLIPCPSALVVLLGAIALGRVGLGLLLIVVFSLGLASVLTLIGVLLVQAGRIFERLPVRGRLFAALPVMSALVIIVVGAGITLQALGQTGLFP